MFAQRADIVLQTHSVKSVATRAVGSIIKIYKMIKKFSTWKSLIIFKGPSWETEWKEFLNSSHKTELKITELHKYTISLDDRTLYLIKLERNI